MALKIGVLALALILAWFTILRPLRGLSAPKKKVKKGRAPRPLQACSRCGVYRPAGEPCDCDP